MFGGLLKSTSLAALVAVAGVAISGVSAQAADLGGNCCADLEERIAELEATTARKGNRKVSLTVSGYVNEAVLAWDDGVERNAYVATNERDRSRFRFVGTAKIDSSWTAGYLLEIGVRGNRQNQTSQDVSSTGKGLDVRHSAWWLQHKDLGKLWVGQTSEATDGITEVNLANTNHFAHAQLDDYIGGFFMRSATGVKSTNSIANITGVGSGGNNPGEGTRFNLVKYETPTLAGFVGSASWGEDDLWDIALRYAGEFSGIKLAAGIGYTNWDDNNKVVNAVGVAGSSNRNCARAAGTNASCDELGLSASIMHVPTGLYLTGAYGHRNEDHRTQVVGLANSKNKDDFYYVQGGIEQAFFPLGKSTLFGEYFDGRYGGAINTTGAVSVGRTDAGLGFGAALIASSEVNYWGIGFNQNIAAAAMDMYVSFRNYEFDVTSTTGQKAVVNDMQTVTMGAKIQF